MSSDNYYLIRRAGDRFAVSGESASAAELDESSEVALARSRVSATTPIDAESVRWFNTHDEASEYAHGRYAEYGVTSLVDDDHAGDTMSARIGALCAALVAADPEVYEWAMTHNHHDLPRPTVSVQFENFEVTVTGDDRDEVWGFVDWLRLVTPARLGAALGADMPASDV